MNLLSLKNVIVKYGDKKALDINREIDVMPGDIVGIIGSNGAGKSTLIKAITHQVSYSGTIHVPKKISVHLQENVYPNTMDSKNLMEGILKTSYQTDSKLQSLVSFFDFEQNLSKRFSHLSGGQKQRLTLIMVMYEDAPLTCFDEMTTGLDFEARANLMKKIRSWYSNKESTILLITHYYEELKKLANKLLIIEKGNVIDFGEISELFKKYIGFSAIVTEDSQNISTLLPTEHVIRSNDGTIAVSCNSENDQQRIADILVKEQLKFSIKQDDIELIYLNAAMTKETLRA